MASLPPGGHVLDLGCGAGWDALEIKRSGFRLTAIDGCAQLAAEAESRLGQPVRVQLFEDIDDVAVFDAVWANASLLHVPKAALPAVVARIHRALKPSGLFGASFKTGGAEGRDDLGRYYNNPSRDELAAALPTPAWTIFDINESEGSGYDGVATNWLAISAKRN
jgi:SAM-dependent methyltransferase